MQKLSHFKEDKKHVIENKTVFQVVFKNWEFNDIKILLNIHKDSSGKTRILPVVMMADLIADGDHEG